jgi:hypothetical protein
MIRLDVHIDTRQAEEFMVAFSNLRVVPTWPRPSDPGEESPAPPHVVYVVAEAPAGPSGAVEYRLIGCAQYPNPAPLQTGPLEHGYAQSLFIPPPSEWGGPGPIDPIAYDRLPRAAAQFDELPPLHS